jgi:tripartite-type tricarboxylate transporter receptor subunit TctC
MPLHTRRLLGATLAALCALLAPWPAGAQAYPSKPIVLVLPFPPGGSFDPILRALGQAAAKELGQPVVLMHKPGAGGVTGTASLATMTEADGYTLAVMHNSVIRQPLMSKTNWDPLKDFTYVIGLASLSTGIAVAADAPWKRWPICSPTPRRARATSAGATWVPSAPTASLPNGWRVPPASSST